MTDSEKLDLLLTQMQAMNERMDGLENQAKTMNERMDGVELQIKSTERVLKNQIVKSESLVLDEVERVHMILENHANDAKKHTA